MGQQVGNVLQNDVGVITGSKGFTDRQKKFLEVYVNNGFRSTPAAKQAGYENPSQAGYGLMQMPHIIAAVKKHHDKELCGDMTSLALKTMRYVLEDKREDPITMRLKVAVAKTVIDRARIGAPEHDPADAAKPLERLTKAELVEVIDKWERVKEGKAIDVTAEVVVSK